MLLMLAEKNKKETFYVKGDFDLLQKDLFKKEQDDENFKEMIKIWREKLLNFLDQYKFELNEIDICLFKRFFKISFKTLPLRTDIQIHLEKIIER